LPLRSFDFQRRPVLLYFSLDDTIVSLGSEVAYFVIVGHLDAASAYICGQGSTTTQAFCIGVATFLDDLVTTVLPPLNDPLIERADGKLTREDLGEHLILSVR